MIERSASTADYSPDIVAFIKARLDEAERTISRTGHSVLGWATFLRDNGQMAYGTPVSCRAGKYITDSREVHPASVIEVYDSAAMLRGIEAKRRIVDACLKADEEMPDWGGAEHEDYPGGYLNGLKFAVRMLASEWSAHQDFRPEWAQTRKLT